MLAISEQRGAATATVPASGSWPPAGATVNLFMLRNAAQSIDGDVIELVAIDYRTFITTARTSADRQ